jgi:CBS-domain-containing membrane protein
MLLLWGFFATVRYHVIRYLPLEFNSRDLIGHLGSRNSVHFTSTTVSRRLEANFATKVKVVTTPRVLSVLTYTDDLFHL